MPSRVGEGSVWGTSLLDGLRKHCQAHCGCEAPGLGTGGRRETVPQYVCLHTL